MMHIALLFASQFICVLLLVMQSINNNHGRRRLAFITSIGIGIAQIISFKLLPDADVSEVIAWVTAGPLANSAATWLKRHDVSRIEQLRSGK